ncbi:unnamed protein product [Musa textilis]
MLQTLALKVSTHCEGCKREVKRILNMEGVYRISFGPQQHKVVVIGNVAAETLVKKLTKSGKHAELWPEPLPDGGGGGKKKKKKKKKKSKNKNKSDGKPNDPPEVPENNQSSSGDESSPEAPDKPEGESTKSDDKGPPPAREKPNGMEKAAATNAGGGKKKGKKSHNANSNNNNSGGGGNPGGTGAPPQEFGKKAAGGLAIPPALNLPFYNTSQQPSYVVSYSSVHPSNNYGGAYHPAAPMQHGNCVYSTAAPGSCYIFSEENANACSVM